MLVAAAVVARSDRSLRLRLVFVFAALALSPSLITLVVLWRELAPGLRLAASQGIERSMQSGLLLARELLAERHAEAGRLASAGAARTARSESAGAPLDSLAAGPYVALLFEPQRQQILAVHGPWSGRAARTFLEQGSVHWPAAGFPADLVPAPDSSYVVVATAPVASPRDTLTGPPAPRSRFVLVALPIPRATSDAILSVVQGVRQSQRLGFLERLKLATTARVLGLAAIVYVGLAVLLGALLARTLTRPIERLRRALEAVAGGDFGHQVEVGASAQGEVSRLLHGFNAMSRELQESKRQLVRATRLAAWQDVARRLAHEIKNPLTPITLSIHRLRRRTQESDTVVRECLDTILEETSHLERLANEFSSFARLPKPELRAIEAAPLLQQVFDLYSAHPGVRIRADLHDMPRVLADRDQVRQVFTNLMKNAVEAMPEGGEVEVRWEKSNGTLQVSVLDAGSGFAPQALEHLYDPTFTTKPGGSGLGLAIVRRILEDHGGSIEVANRPEGGACVRVGMRIAE